MNKQTHPGVKWERRIFGIGQSLSRECILLNAIIKMSGKIEARLIEKREPGNPAPSCAEQSSGQLWSNQSGKFCSGTSAVLGMLLFFEI